MFRIGFEIEFISFNRQENVWNELVSIGLDLLPLRQGRGNFNHWYLSTDSSINYAERPFTGLELISPVMPLVPGLRMLRKCFDYMKERGHLTNDSTGFHIGISFQDKDSNYRINRAALISLMDEDRWLTLWNRKNNGYCQSQENNLINQIADQYENIDSINWNDAEYYITSSNKYQSVNFRKLTSNDPYIEFRIMGGTDYHKRYRDVLKTTKAFVKAMRDSKDAKSLDTSAVSSLSSKIEMAIKERQAKKDQLMSLLEARFESEDNNKLLSTHDRSDVDGVDLNIDYNLLNSTTGGPGDRGRNSYYQRPRYNLSRSNSESDLSEIISNAASGTYAWANSTIGRERVQDNYLDANEDIVEIDESIPEDSAIEQMNEMVNRITKIDMNEPYGSIGFYKEALDDILWKDTKSIAKKPLTSIISRLKPRQGPV